MVEPRLPQSTVRFVDNYCQAYRYLFSDVRSFEAFTSLHLGLIAPLARKSLPAIAKAVGLPNDQVLHHFLTHSPWQVEAVRDQRLFLILEQIKRQPIVLVLDDTGDRKKGSLVLADSFYGESHPFLDVLDKLKLPWIMAIRSNHGVWMPQDAEISYSPWQAFERVFADGETETRYIQEIIFGRRFEWQYWTLTSDPVLLPPNSTWMVMSHLPLEPDPTEFIGNLYGLRTWIEYGFKQCKNELGWAEYRLTHYEQIERWWEMVSSAYLMVSLQFYGLGAQPPSIVTEAQRDLLTRLQQHPHWQETKGWKRRFNNVQLLVQPFIFFCLLQPWMRLFDVSTLERGFTKLIQIINAFPGWSPLAPSAPIQHFSSA